MGASVHFEDLVNLMRRLREKGGCPWDIEQTHESLKQYLVEETYEVIDAIDSGDEDKLKEELGDLFYQIIFHAQISEENGAFNMHDILKLGMEKMTRRHPHVFGNSKASNTKEVLEQWDEIKKKEKGHEDRKYVVDGVPKHLPALQKAQKIQKKVAKVGFDWTDIKDVIAKVEEEFTEFKAEINHIKDDVPPEAQAESNIAAIEEELGDFFFAIVNLARFLKLDSENVLQKAIHKFSKRFRGIEDELKANGKSIEDASLDEMDAAWNKVKLKPDTGC
ncbi:MAG: nucleoside triphosphate pyrophosphohydrolase [Candidatus Anammoxibacter sp.]